MENTERAVPVSRGASPHMPDREHQDQGEVWGRVLFSASKAFSQGGIFTGLRGRVFFALMLDDLCSKNASQSLGFRVNG
jgi:hypothetical protein